MKFEELGFGDKFTKSYSLDGDIYVKLNDVDRRSYLSPDWHDYVNSVGVHGEKISGKFWFMNSHTEVELVY